MRCLIVDDDLASRRLLEKILEPYADCDFALDGGEAIAAVRLALDDRRPYDLICLDIMMPEMDGQAALRNIRAQEEAREIISSSGAKIVMTTALADRGNVIEAAKNHCDGFLVKPIQKERLINELRKLKLIS